MSENPTLADCVSRWPVPSQVRINPQCVTLSLSCEDTIRAYKSGWIRLDVDNVYRMGGFEYEDVSKILVKFGLTIGNRELYYEGKPVNPTFILPTVEELAYTGAITPHTPPVPPPPSLPHPIGTVIRFHVDKMADKSLVYSLRANGKFVKVGNLDTGKPSFAVEDCVEGRYPGPYNIISLPDIIRVPGMATFANLPIGTVFRFPSGSRYCETYVVKPDGTAHGNGGTIWETSVTSDRTDWSLPQNRDRLIIM